MKHSSTSRRRFMKQSLSVMFVSPVRSASKLMDEKKPEWSSSPSRPPLVRIETRGVARIDACGGVEDRRIRRDRKSTRLNSSHVRISYAVFCLKKKSNSHCHHKRVNCE